MTKNLLDELVAAGGYADVAEVIAAAVANQALLHAKMGAQGSLVIADAGAGGSSRWVSADDSHGSSPSRVPSVVTAVVSPPTRVPAAVGGNDIQLRVPALFGLDELTDAAVTPTSLPDDVWVSGQEVPIARWLFGQYNRLLPAKASCRALAHLLTAEPEGVALSSASAQIAEAAAHLGDHLAEWDKSRGVTRDEALATAFPKTGEGGDKGRLRFASQFVAWTNGNGQLSGLLMGLKLINRTSHKDPRINLTETGWKFALLKNPVLDAEELRKTNRLSDDECLLLLDHIKGSVPAEDFAYRTVLKGLDEGANTPESLDAFLVGALPAGAAELTKEFVATQRSGVLSRMIDLGMIARVRDGVRVSYAISQRAREYSIQGSKR